jgi:putative NIF3 family GTP cyclohydrolase 1 type 2
MGISLINKLFDKSIISSHKILETYSVEGVDYGIGDITTFNKKLKFDEILTIIKSKLELSDEKISYYKVNDDICKIITIPGSGSSEIDLVINEKPDLLITSDLKHNQILDLTEEGISYINATHYGLEKIFIESFSNYLINDLNYKNIYRFYLNLL